MLKTLTTIFATIALLLSFNANAIDPYTAVPEKHQKLISSIESNLDVDFQNNDNRFDFYNKYLKTYLEETTWNYQPMANKSRTAVAEDWTGNDGFFKFVISNPNRNIFFTIFSSKENNSLYISSTQVLSASVQVVVNLYKERKQENNQVTLYDSENYSMFNKKDFISYTNYHVANNAGSVSYNMSSIFTY
tara:strand:- start:18310 stop:18879 length:570 start_codon:yes stop_codon:yes gene_type:complete